MISSSLKPTDINWDSKVASYLYLLEMRLDVYFAVCGFFKRLCRSLRSISVSISRRPQLSIHLLFLAVFFCFFFFRTYLVCFIRNWLLIIKLNAREKSKSKEDCDSKKTTQTQRSFRGIRRLRGEVFPRGDLPVQKLELCEILLLVCPFPDHFGHLLETFLVLRRTTAGYVPCQGPQFPDRNCVVSAWSLEDFEDLRCYQDGTWRNPDQLNRCGSRRNKRS